MLDYTNYERNDCFFYRECLKNVGVWIYGDQGKNVYTPRKYPKLKYSKKDDQFILYFNGPLGYGLQSFYFDYYDFCIAYEDSKFNRSKPLCDRQSFFDIFFGPNWIHQNNRIGMIAVIFFCFNLTPSFLRRAMKAKQKLTLQPKLKHCELISKILPLPQMQQFLITNSLKEVDKDPFAF